jgi:TolB-like protein
LLYRFDDFALDSDRRELRRGPQLIAMPPQAFDILEYLIRNRERVVSKDDLFASIWHGRIVSDSALTTRINAARCAIDDTGEEQRFIRTLPRKGVRFIAPVHEEQKPPVPRPDPSLAVTHANPALFFPDRPSIAVLPFANLSGDQKQDDFADGVAEEIIIALSRCSWLFVISRNSSFAYKGNALDVRQIGRELGVRYLLEGSVRRGGDRLRITGKLIDATSGGHIWAERFECSEGNVLELQDRFAESMIAAIEPQLQLAEIARLHRKPASSLDPYDLLLRAQQCEYEFGADSFDSALRYLDQALAVGPSYAPAMALAAHCHAVRRVQGWMKDPEAETIDGMRLASRAVELGKDDANILRMAGYAMLRLEMDLPRARELINHSLDINPNSAMAAAVAGGIEAHVGNIGKSLELLDRARRLSPRDPHGWFITLEVAWTNVVGGKFEDAISAARKVLNQNPRSSFALRFVAASLARQGRLNDASRVLRQALAIEPVTLTKLRSRLMFLDQNIWHDYAAALRLAGISE